jgi:1-deoxy-D-xylulose-5-phosphate synthase
VFGQVLCDLAEKDPRVVGITPAMATGSGMSRFAAMFRDRFFDVGIVEEHAATFAAGLAAGGARPYCAIYSSFAQRAYDQIIHDVALQHLPVVFCFDRAGLVGEDGATHQGVFDLAAFRSIPNCVISAPRDESELARLLHSGLDAGSGPFIIRYPRGCGEGAPWKTAGTEKVPLGKGEKIVDGEVIAILALGPEACRAAEAAEAFRQRHGFSPAVYDMRFLKPVDTSILEEAMTSYKAVLTVEEGCLKGGLFSEACEYMAASGHSVPLHGLGVPDRFITQDSQPSQRAACSLDCEGILGELERIFKKS